MTEQEVYGRVVELACEKVKELEPTVEKVEVLSIVQVNPFEWGTKAPGMKPDRAWVVNMGVLCVEEPENEPDMQEYAVVCSLKDESFAIVLVSEYHL